MNSNKKDMRNFQFHLWHKELGSCVAFIFTIGNKESSELEGLSIETSQTKMQREKKIMKKQKPLQQNIQELCGNFERSDIRSGILEEQRMKKNIRSSWELSKINERYQATNAGNSDTVTDAETQRILNYLDINTCICHIQTSENQRQRKSWKNPEEEKSTLLTEEQE